MVLSFSRCVKIEGDHPLPIEISVGKPNLDLKEDKEEEEGDDDEDLPAELVRVAKCVLSPGYSISEGRLSVVFVTST